ncbi:hypothetical protein MCOR27_005732 [Pyricularia oryzae]|uniref:CNH domain-containing protein n=2 Tax=Pyricularia TaxID=48558 RepID=A0ABQ8NTW0_PYRGI|nr:hypothetical protein MCOR02_004560 [Pyricularia oryzae]KAI6302076.1 hypothetical protein MCOR33_002534 [Pyricularia grisea]KAI6259559.1 hypothetical protein MCOR19_004100 [Pyricularia oryzae]KAI6275871.1 hypothetical protein MCOR26_005846 [Pyricularia oryzae]KAI6278113.1 hypothetical protein MCOR27_005732 [Pyricularia oryzae]
MAATILGEGAVLTKPPLEAGPFVLRNLLHDVPLSADGGEERIRINCVDYWESNLYIGTSASELLHFVQIPPDPADKNSTSTFILASRLQPFFPESASTGAQPGVQQILLLPRVGKACILCNSTVTFYSLPELSPVFNEISVKGCNWIGGVDLNHEAAAAGNTGGTVSVLLSLNRRIQVVNVGEDNVRGSRKIDFAGSTLSIRRDSIACVADSRTYALVDVDRQLKIPLMSISSLDTSQSPSDIGHVQSIAAAPDSNNGSGLTRSASSATTRPSHLSTDRTAGHNRSTSLGTFGTGGPEGQGSAAGADTESTASRSPGGQSPSRSPAPDADALSKPPPPPPPETDKPLPPIRPAVPEPAPILLKPLIVSPTPEEFLLVTGTGPSEPGIGMFVNLDGDPTRPTLEFESYPSQIAVDGGSQDLSTSSPSLGLEEEGYVLASLMKEVPKGGCRRGLEIQRWDVNIGENEPEKYWLGVDEIAPENEQPQDAPPSTPEPLGIRSLLGSEESILNEVVDRLCQRRFLPFSFAGNALNASTMSLRSLDARTASSMERVSKERDLFERDLDSPDEDPLPEGWEAARNAEEESSVVRLAKVVGRLAVWENNRIWWALRNPLLLQLEAGIEANPLDCDKSHVTSTNAAKDRRQLFAILNSFRGRDARTELEFLTFSYIRQRAGILLFSSFLDLPSEAPFSEPELGALEEVLLDSGLDPRVVLSLVPGLRHEIIQGRTGIWVFGGVKGTVERYLTGNPFNKAGQEAIANLDPRILQFLRRFLTACRKRKGFGSVRDGQEVSRTVDASLLAVLLELDKESPPGLPRGGPSSSTRAEINELVDRGVDCFERAVDLLESYNRLYVLSRLYQSRKMAGEVLATWRRIIEDERDDGGEFQNGEQRVRDYLSKVSSQGLVREYGVWLASRNPKLGVQVFSDDQGRAPNFHPAEVVSFLREEAPDAVKYYLEHLVFDKGHTTYVSELVNHYLDVVMTDLETSPDARDKVAAIYKAYRALRPPKPTFRRFLTDNAPPGDEAWHSRLRLLQLLEGPHEYDARAIRERISRGQRKPQQQAQDGEAQETLDTQNVLLVPETIILDGREGRHESALRLLIHKLGDYDSAVLYCLRQRHLPDSRPAHKQKTDGSAGGKKKQRHEAESAAQAAAVATTRALFRTVLGELLALEDVGDRLEQTGALLERFGAWFDVLEVLELIPNSWVIDAALSEFLVSALRRLVRERHEGMVTRALSSAENLRVRAEMVAKIDEKGPVVDAGDGQDEVEMT